MTTTTFWKAAEQVLREAGKPLDYREITQRALAGNLLRTAGETPEATMSAQLAVKIRNLGDESPFVRTAPGVFGLREWVESGQITALLDSGTGGTQIRIPNLPPFASHRRFLQAVDGIPRADFLAMKAEVWKVPTN